MRTNDISRPVTPIRVLSRSQRRSLAGELSNFTSASDRLDLETLLETYPAADTRDVREILARQAA